MLTRFAVVICTRHHPPSVGATVRSALASDPAPAWVILVDQSERSQVSDQAAPEEGDDYTTDERFIAIKFDAIGLSRARNRGIAAAEALGAEFVACTDDDCVAMTNWLAGFATLFAQHPDLALVFGSTRAAITGRVDGLIPAYTTRKTALYRGLKNKAMVEGMGACMALSVRRWRSVGGFDDWLGAGARLTSSEENDLSVRLLLRGYAVGETTNSEVLHYGFRDHQGVISMVSGYMKGSGATTAKMIRLGGLQSLLPLAAIGRRWLQGRSPVLIQPLPSRRMRMRSFLNGALVGWFTPLERRSGRFKPLVGCHDMEAPPLRH